MFLSGGDDIHFVHILKGHALQNNLVHLMRSEKEAHGAGKLWGLSSDYFNFLKKQESRTLSAEAIESGGLKRKEV